jgi:hypothetical protein
MFRASSRPSTVVAASGLLLERGGSSVRGRDLIDASGWLIYLKIF